MIQLKYVHRYLNSALFLTFDLFLHTEQNADMCRVLGLIDVLLRSLSAYSLTDDRALKIVLTLNHCVENNSSFTAI